MSSTRLSIWGDIINTDLQNKTSEEIICGNNVGTGRKFLEPDKLGSERWFTVYQQHELV